FAAGEEAIRDALLQGLAAGEQETLRRVLEPYEGGLRGLVGDLGGHDLGDVLEALAAAHGERERPTVIFAYTIKGYGLAIAGRPQNHSALLTAAQVDRLRSECSLTMETEWDAFEPDSPEGRLLAEAARRLERGARSPAARVHVPTRLS